MEQTLAHVAAALVRLRQGATAEAKSKLQKALKVSHATHNNRQVLAGVLNCLAPLQFDAQDVAGAFRFRLRILACLRPFFLAFPVSSAQYCFRCLLDAATDVSDAIEARFGPMQCNHAPNIDLCCISHCVFGFWRCAIDYACLCCGCAIALAPLAALKAFDLSRCRCSSNAQRQHGNCQGRLRR